MRSGMRAENARDSIKLTIKNVVNGLIFRSATGGELPLPARLHTTFEKLSKGRTLTPTPQPNLAHRQVPSARLIAEKLRAVPDHQTVVFARGHSG